MRRPPRTHARDRRLHPLRIASNSHRAGPPAGGQRRGRSVASSGAVSRCRTSRRSEVGSTHARSTSNRAETRLTENNSGGRLCWRHGRLGGPRWATGRSGGVGSEAGRASLRGCEARGVGATRIEWTTRERTEPPLRAASARRSGRQLQATAGIRGHLRGGAGATVQRRTGIKRQSHPTAGRRRPCEFARDCRPFALPVTVDLPVWTREAVIVGPAPPVNRVVRRAEAAIRPVVRCLCHRSSW